MPAALQPPSAMLFGEELIWKQPIDKLDQEGKGDLPEQQLLMMYQVLMRSMLHYSCVAYMSAAEIHLQKKLELEQMYKEHAVELIEPLQ